MNRLIFILTLISAGGAGLIAGVFYAFSTFVMRALAQLAPAEGIRAMQAINRTVLNGWFLGVFAGTAASCLGLVVIGVSRWQQPDALYLIGGGLLYIVGTFLLTGTVHVPMNNALERVDPASERAAKLWARYLVRWTRWNHVRTAAALLAMMVLIIGM